MARPLISIIIPARDEAQSISETLDALLEQTVLEPSHRLQQNAELAPIPAMEVIVAANGCIDDTAAVARQYQRHFREKGVRFRVVELSEPGKPQAINCALSLAEGACVAFLDADVCIGSTMISQTLSALDTPAPRFVSGRLTAARATSVWAHLYLRTWLRLPFHDEQSIPGAGYFALNATGLRRIGSVPNIIADDLYARLHFQPHERIMVDVPYEWKVSHRFWEIVRMRKRQDDGVRELYRLYPALKRNEAKRALTLLDHIRLICQAPLSYCVYVSVRYLGVLMPSHSAQNWARGH